MSVTFMDGRIFEIGQRVTAICEAINGGDVDGVVIGFGKSMGAITIKVQADNPKMVRNAYQLKDGGDYDKLRDIGLSAGCFEIID